MRYYDVGLAIDKHWNSPVFTYSSTDNLSIPSIVEVPFGEKQKLGLVLKAVNKPTFTVKSISFNHGVTPNTEFIKFMNWFSEYYLDKTGQLYKLFLPNRLSRKPTKNINQPRIKDIKEIILTPYQEKTVAEVQKTTKPTVLHGITGSGKTRMYAKMMQGQLYLGKNCLLLYPEISLTSQLIEELSHYGPIFVYHSQLTESEKSKLWLTIQHYKKPYIIIGARSSMFLPINNLGLVIVDEVQENSFKQDAGIRYDTPRVAAGLSKAHNAKLVLGSATPPLTETELVLKSGGDLVCIHQKPSQNNSKKDVKIIDIKNRKLFNKHSLLSDPLIEAISKNLSLGKQSLLFLNRRGTAKLLFCNSDSCDWQAKCPKCELAYTYHHDNHKLLCHTCGSIDSVPLRCPTCNGSTRINILGSKAITEDIGSLFPAAKIGRFDSDTSNAESFNQQYNKIRGGLIDILIGTQQLAKGLDLPNLTTLGIINADLSLNFPDYSSDEKTFQIITQAMGRVGRGHDNGIIILQTVQPNNPIFRFAINEDWHGFRENELINRKRHGFPPFSYCSKLIFRESSEKKSINKALNAKKILSQSEGIIIEGPVPSHINKRGGYFYYQINLRSKSRSKILKCIEKYELKNAAFDLDANSLL